MAQLGSSSAFGGLFLYAAAGQQTVLTTHPARPATLLDPTGRALRIATVEVAESGAICPSCAERSNGGFVSFVADLRMVYACPRCEALVWMRGA